MPPPLPSLQLRRLLLRTFTSSANPLQSHSRIIPTKTSFPHPPPPRFPLFPSSRLFSSQTNADPQTPADPTQIALSFSKELTGTPAEADPQSISQRLHLSFSHITPNRDLILRTLNLSPEAGRAALGFSDWLDSISSFSHDDETVSLFVDYFGRRKDFKGMLQIIAKHKDLAGAKTLESAVDRLVRAGRAKQVVEFFERMEIDYGLKRDRESLTLVVKKLCERGHGSFAEKMVKSTVNEIFPDERICDLLISGWCAAGKLDEATRFAGEMARGGFEIGTVAYNVILDCVCKLCRKKDPFRLQSEVEKVLLEMETRGVPRNTETFNVLINNLCKIRRTEEAMELFGRMGEWGCQPDAETYLVLIRSLYQAARIGEGDELIDKMKSAGYGKALDKKEYYGFLKILCGIERLEHAMVVFKNMKADGCKPGIKTYDLLMGKMCANNQVTRANGLYKEAARRGVEVSPKEYRVDPRFLKKKSKEVVDSNVKKRETLPEKTARKRRKLKQINMSFVKKPRNKMRRRM
ncbi:Pentatricopeptide repeat-containing protein PNM1 [Raphanus sativus]|uniref:Pentatricopeptide repeat-containing protein PNM1, mitochondrial n=1 Tax=Raphanus sativus TaxID=3726 RepID=A0A6J0P2J1_RAPSA|nr:pentatricopeptide repeat-containing protein PNM1, mitochondrial [Raphanus sativus]KAJ4900350.1 Pentatricopeptide repeat-containing protein PNM1 [Raphanus sativus]